MKKKILMGLLSGLLLFGPALSVQADTLNGGSGWNVTFTDEDEMVSSFSSGDMNDVLSGMQPGDTAIFTIALKNSNSSATDWYMKNEVLTSLEDSNKAGASGGAYSYRLTYTDPDGSVDVLYDSDTVGGETSALSARSSSMNGLYSATNALDDYFFLDTLDSGEGGTITLTVGLDGETQGNAYQDTLANLDMRFAVELETETGASNNSVQQMSYEDPDDGSATRIVRTDDESHLTLMLAVSGITGVILLLYCIYCFRENRKKKQGGANG